MSIAGRHERDDRDRASAAGAAWRARLCQAAYAACLVEATTAKPGNVHPGASFADLNYEHFRLAGRAVAPFLSRAAETGVGRAVLEAVRAAQSAAGTNVNLGIVLLLAPLCAVPPDRPLVEGIAAVLARLSIDDARDVYAAIRLAQPGGLGRAAEQDVARPPTLTLREVMCLAADRDRIARQYATRFEDVLGVGAPHLAGGGFASEWETAVVRLHLELLARFPDSLIARKCGEATAQEASRRARDVLESGWPDSALGAARLEELDRWLRADGHRRNPGTTADLVAASLFAAFREQLIPIPDWVETCPNCIESA